MCEGAPVPPRKRAPRPAMPVPAGAREVFTDGGCSRNPGPGGWAWAVDTSVYASGYDPATTNQRMEIRAALEAVRALDGPLLVVSDSTYVVNCFRDEWWRGWLAAGLDEQRSAAGREPGPLGAVRRARFGPRRRRVRLGEGSLGARDERLRRPARGRRLPRRGVNHRDTPVTCGVDVTGEASVTEQPMTHGGEAAWSDWSVSDVVTRLRLPGTGCRAGPDRRRCWSSPPWSASWSHRSSTTSRRSRRPALSVVVGAGRVAAVRGAADRPQADPGPRRAAVARARASSRCGSSRSTSAWPA